MSTCFCFHKRRGGILTEDTFPWAFGITFCLISKFSLRGWFLRHGFRCERHRGVLYMLCKTWVRPWSYFALLSSCIAFKTSAQVTANSTPIDTEPQDPRETHHTCMIWFSNIAHFLGLVTVLTLNTETTELKWGPILFFMSLLKA